jgi:mercuric ion binding protein
MENVIMRIYACRGRQQLRALVSSVVLMTVAVLAGTLTVAAQAPTGSQKQAVVSVQGMQCPFCAYGIKKHLAKLPGVTRVDVELAKNQAIVTFAPAANVTDAQIQQAIRKAGFTPGKIEWQSVGEGKKTTGAHAAERRHDCVGCEAKLKTREA